MTDCGERGYIRVFRSIARIIIAAALLCLLSFAWFVGHLPDVHASGVPYCGKLTEEHAPTRPAIHLNRLEGPVGADLTVTASGWRPGAQVSLRFDAREPKTGELYTFIPQFAQGTVGKDGTITLTSLNAPPFFCVDTYSSDQTAYHFDDTGGTTAYFVLAADDGEVSAPVAFRYLPAPTINVGGVDPSFHDTKVGSTLAVTGSGWEPAEALTITLERAGDVLSVPNPVPFSEQVHATADTHGNFSATYPIDAKTAWNVNDMLVVRGSGPRFGSLFVQQPAAMLPAIEPTFHVDHTLVTPGMTITVSGEHWYPGDVIPLKLCDSQMVDSAWSIGPNCGKAAWPVLAEITIDAGGHMRQQITIPLATPLGESIFIVEVNSRADLRPIPVRVVDHLPNWDDSHPRVAAARNTFVASLPFTIPAVLLLGALTFFAIRRWHMRQKIAG